MVSPTIPSVQWPSPGDLKPVCPSTAELDVEYNELTLSWKRFQDHHIPSPDPQANSHTLPQDARHVVLLLRKMQAGWISSARQRTFARSMELCDRFLATMDSHSVLLMTLSEPCYASLFYGTLQSLFKASASYPKIMEGLLKALVKVNESICLPVGERPSAVVDNMPKVARFYSLTFFLLAEFMDWFVRRSACRLLKSPSQEVYSHFQNLVCSIRGRGLDIMRGFTAGFDLDDRGCAKKRRLMLENASYLWEEARMSQVGLQGHDRRFAIHNAMTRQFIWEIQDDDAQRRRMRAEREFLLSQFTDATNRQIRPVSEQNSGVACLTTTAAQDLDTSRFDWFHGSRRKYARVELQLASGHLQNFFDSDHQVAPFESDVDVVAEDNVMISLRQWTTSRHSKVLALGGPQTTAFPTPVALISACYACFAHQAKLPVISHFCTLPSHARDGLTLFEQGLIALAYSLIRQLVDCLPPVVNSDVVCHLNSERFRLLDGTLNCWKEVLSLIDQLLHQAPPLLICVVDGLDVIQDASTDAYIRSLVRILFTHTRHEPVAMSGGKHGQQVLLKVLFTVAGRPSSLVETLAENQLVVSESNRVDPTALTDAALVSDAGAVVMNA